MVKYKLPAIDGKVTVELPKGAKVKEWISYGSFVIVDLDKEYKTLEEYKI